MLISMREFARRNGVDVAAISRAIKAGRLPSVAGKIDPEQAQSVWDRVKDQSQVGRKLKRADGVDHRRGGVDPRSVNTESAVDPASVNTALGTSEVNIPRVDPAPVNTTSGQRIPVTVAVNGAEELGLAKAASDLGVTIQSFVLSRCGVQTWRLGAPARASHRRPVRLALERRTITVYLSPEDHTALKDQSRQAGLSLPQYIRTRCGLPVRWASMPGTEDRDREEDEAYVILRGLGLNADSYLED